MTTNPTPTQPKTLEPCGVCKFHWNMIVMSGDEHNRNCPHFDERDKGSACQGCGQRYKVDVEVSNDLWNRIRPEGKPEGAGLLCGRCIFSRVEALGKHDDLLLTRRAAVAGPRGDAKFTPPAEDALHIAICQAVQEHHGPTANAILREALNDYRPTQLTRTELIRVQQRSGSGDVTAVMVSPAATSSPTKAHRCPHCGRTMQSDFDEDVGMWYECDNCDYREAVSSAAANIVAPDSSMTPEQLERAALIAESRGIDLETAQELVYLRDAVAMNAAPPERTRVEGERVVKEDVHDWLKEQCSRLLYGQCTTLRCLRRGGYTGGGYSASIATCEAYEVSQVLTTTTIFGNARRELETAANEIANRYFGDYPERAYPKLLAILSHYFPFAAAPADNDAESLLSVAELRSVCCSAPTRTATTDYNVCTACKEACETTATTTKGDR